MSDKPKKFKVGISIGDMNGIGPEVIIKTLRDKRILEFCTPIIYGSSRALSYYSKLMNIEDFHPHTCNSLEKINPNRVNVINLWTEAVNIVPGEVSDEMGKYALLSLEQAANDLIEGRIDTLVTAPVNKYLIQKHKAGFSGQTEYLTEKTEGGKGLMLLVSGGLRVGLVSNHLPLAEVPGSVSKERILEKLRLLHQTLKKDFRVQKPKIAVLGLNPHAGDRGLLGSEEIEIITPAIESAQEEGMLAFGPYAADGLFGSGGYRKFDGILAMYHDQGLAPFKALTFSSGVNYTAGLPVVRTSPDHGTAYDIAGKNKGNEESFRSALFLAIDILAKRHNYEEMTAHPLLKSQREREYN